MAQKLGINEREDKRILSKCMRTARAGMLNGNTTYSVYSDNVTFLARQTN